MTSTSATDLLPQRLSLAIAILLLLLGSLAWLHKQDVDSSHIRVTAQVVSTEVRSTRVNAENIRRLYHLMVKAPAGDGTTRLLTLKDGLPQIQHKAGQMVELLYPVEQIEDIRLPQMWDKSWPWMSLAFASLVAFMAMMLFRKEYGKRHKPKEQQE